ncbi:glycosyltransferase [Acidithiobacillus thiooxidans]|jgi:cellulose synthase/poly-beta-1,6-N-acetylglucosamine synthase-like glycosyltransferase|uniref:glycosyltransferase n=1 Tax=Acidithiobacillus TaxID=119977 RepID=UPI000262512E|nr:MULTISPECIES: glycosyltransferase [Acidithiobacillus]MBE7567493.1 glycosyltransferase [Acidithiobacillus sp. HP-11]MBU2750009.1 glycosyltransferase [Acidithiobacillus thiooxidans]MBU2791836.1 glycosyltransferase [Acidithiobacillus thiooxidans]MBU2809873.1 glycosyltransferase [Acidithiobacillus thiooxidans]
MTDLSVLVPSYRRPDDLRRCLEALCCQYLAPVQVIVVARDVDKSSHLVAQAFAERLPLEIVKVNEPGVVHALNTGLLSVKAEIVAITDDDAAPHSDWLARIAAHFEADSRIGGVGGRDWVHTPDGTVVDGQRRMVGRVQWFGRIVGNHHLGVGPAREVDILKGVNMSFRRTAMEGLRFDTCLRGMGAQVHNEMGFSLAVKRRGWKLMYDPEVAVDHYPAPRMDFDQRGVFHPDATENAAFNWMWVTQTQLIGGRRWMSRQWQVWVGDASAMGYIHFFRALLRANPLARAKYRAAKRGRELAISLLRVLNSVQKLPELGGKQRVN